MKIDFDVYCANSNTGLFKKFNSDYFFYKQKFNHRRENNIESSNEYSWIKNICNLKYNYYITEKKTLTTDSIVNLDMTRLRHINVKSLIICTLLKIQKYFFDKNNYVGFLFRDSIHSNFNNCIGELTAEGIISCDLENINYITVNKELFNSYRRPIFNYSMYNLDELYLEENKVPIFLNFSKTQVDYRDISYSFNTSFYGAAVVKGDIEPNIILYSNGCLLCRWLIDENNISKENMIKFKELFKLTIKQEIASL